jgi:Tfp pilus assembly protein PilF
MKKCFSLLAIVLFAGAVNLSAQKFEVNSAVADMRQYDRDNNYPTLLSAKAHIDKATVHIDTKDDANTWVHRGEIYQRLYQKELNEKLALHVDVTDGNKKSMMAFEETPTANLTEAGLSYLKAKSLDTKKIYSEYIRMGLDDIYYKVQMVGIALSNQQKDAEALPFFEMAVDIAASSKRIDTVNIHNSAVTAFAAKNFDKATRHYLRLTELKYQKGESWNQLAECYLAKGDTVKYRETISAGLKMYPMDQNLLVSDVNIKMAAGKHNEAIEQLNALIAQRPDDPELNFVVGNVYDRLANPKNADGSDAVKPANYEELLSKAEQYYKRAIELKPTYIDANYNLGVLYYNQSVYYYNQSQSSIADAAKYKDMWSKPLPAAVQYLEVAHKLDPKDLNTLIALKLAYGQMGDNDNYKRIKDEIAKVQKGE